MSDFMSMGPQEITDTERLNFMMERSYWIAWSKDGESCRVFHHRDDDGDTGPVMGWVPAAWAYSPREAIDKAMRYLA